MPKPRGTTSASPRRRYRWPCPRRRRALSPKVDEGLQLLIWRRSSDAEAAAPNRRWRSVVVFSAVRGGATREAEYSVPLDAGGCGYGFGRAAWR
jgi:hypothetical protein